MRGQVSLEYLIIIGIAIGIMIPAVFFFYTYSKSNEGSSTSSQVNDIGLRMVSTAKSAYAQGTGAWQTLEFIMPSSVTRVYVNGTELVFVYDTQYGPSEATFYSTVNMTSTYSDGNITNTLHGGITRYRFTSQGATVFVNETT